MYWLIFVFIEQSQPVFNLSSAMVDLKSDFKIFIALNILSGMHEVIRIMTAILKSFLHSEIGETVLLKGHVVYTFFPTNTCTQQIFLVLGKEHLHHT